MKENSLITKQWVVLRWGGGLYLGHGITANISASMISFNRIYGVEYMITKPGGGGIYSDGDVSLSTPPFSCPSPGVQ